jgi:hypothetical protein
MKVLELQQEKGELLDRLSESSGRTSEREQLCEQQLEIYKTRYENLQRDSQATILCLEMQVHHITSHHISLLHYLINCYLLVKITDLSDKIRVEATTSSALDDYKKRAQLALKKANREVALLTAECAALKEQILQAKESEKVALSIIRHASKCVNKPSSHPSSQAFNELKASVANLEWQLEDAEGASTQLRQEISQLRAQLVSQSEEMRTLRDNHSRSKANRGKEEEEEENTKGIHVISTGEENEHPQKQLHEKLAPAFAAKDQVVALQQELSQLKNQLQQLQRRREQDRQEREREIETAVASAMAEADSKRSMELQRVSLEEDDSLARNNDRLGLF